MTLTLQAWAFESWDDIQLSDRHLDNPSNRYSKDHAENWTFSNTPAVSGAVSLCPSTLPWSPASVTISSGNKPGHSTLSFSFRNNEIKEEPELEKKNHIEVDIIPILDGLGRLEIANET